MNKKIILMATLYLAFPLYCQESIISRISPQLQKKKIKFSYEKTDLSTILNDLAAESEINIIIPQGNDALQGSLTFHHPKKITLVEGWNFFNTILQTAGFSIVPKSSFYTIIANGQDPNTRPLPLFVGIKPEELPDSDERIRYIYFFSNINLTNTTQLNEISAILKDMLPAIDTRNISQQLNTSINGLVIASTASRIKGVMQIIATLDETGFTETAIVIPLKYTQGTFIEQLFQGDQKSAGLIDVSSDRFPSFFTDQKKKKKHGRYFSESTRVKLLPPNQIAILGKKDAVQKVKEFIETYIDLPLDPEGKAKSLIHIYDLQYLDAKSFKTVLDSVLKGPQDQQGSGKISIGDADFSNVIIAAETEVAAKTVQGGIQAVQQQNGDQSQQPDDQSKAYIGGNRLIIAARDYEWQLIKKLIDSLDNIQPQVALDVLIVDLTLDAMKALGSQLRNKQLSPFFKSVNFQSAHLANPWLNFADDNTTVLNPPGIAADLLHPELPSSINPNLSTSTVKANIAASVTPGVEGPFSEAGSFFLSASEKNCGYPSQFTNPIWYLLQALQTSSNAHVVSRPFVVTANNTKADIITSQERLVTGEATVENSGPAIVNQKNLTAALQVSVTPRISAGKNVNLTLTINSNQFVSDNPNDNTIQTRTISTNANVQDGHVLVLGGLMQDRESKTILETPILGKIPILGYFFKKQSKIEEKNSLVVFIMPRIISPYSAYQTGISPYTHDKLDKARAIVESDQSFGTQKDPIAKAFFGSDATDDSVHQINRFIDRDAFKEQAELMGFTPAQPIDENSTTIKAAPQKKETQSSKLRDMLNTLDNPLKK
ncbi:MAG: hypothetical protein WD068_00335 [Candidatus Babeliales bacterium]